MEQLVNFQATSNLSGSINNSVTTITLVSSASFPSSYPFRIRIDDEIMKVTATPGSNQFTVVRADGSTTAASHSSGANVQAVLTKEALDALISFQSAGSEISTRRIINFINPGITLTDNSGSSRCDVLTQDIEAAYTQPTTSLFTGYNMGSGSDLGTVSNSGTGVFLRDSVQGGTWGEHCRVQYRLLSSDSMSAPWTVRARVTPFITGTNHQNCGVGFFNSSSKKMMTARFLQSGSGSLTIDKWTDGNTFSATYLTHTNYHGFWRWIKLVDDNTNRITSVSMDGNNWIVLHTVGRTDFATADAICFYANANNNNGTNVYNAGILVSSWSIVSGSV